jgi:hypothetical protein
METDCYVDVYKRGLFVFRQCTFWPRPGYIAVTTLITSVNNARLNQLLPVFTQQQSHIKGELMLHCSLRHIWFYEFWYFKNNFTREEGIFCQLELEPFPIMSISCNYVSPLASISTRCLAWFSALDEVYKSLPGPLLAAPRAPRSKLLRVII